MSKVKYNPLVSILICSYNQEDTIEETINGALNQTYKDIEIIYIDDCSIDNTFERATKVLYGKGICIKKNQNKGLIDSINIGLAKFQGDLLLMIGGDDYWYQNCVQRLVDESQRFPDAVISGNADKITYSGKVIGVCSRLKKEIFFPPSKMRHFLRWRTNPFPAFVVCYPEKFIKSISQMPANIYFEDIWLRWAAISNGFSHYYFPESLGAYRLTPNSMSRNKKKYINGIIKSFFATRRFMMLQDIPFIMLRSMYLISRIIFHRG